MSMINFGSINLYFDFQPYCVQFLQSFSHTGCRFPPRTEPFWITHSDERFHLLFHLNLSYLTSALFNSRRLTAFLLMNTGLPSSQTTAGQHECLRMRTEGGRRDKRAGESVCGCWTDINGQNVVFPTMCGWSELLRTESFWKYSSIPPLSCSVFLSFHFLRICTRGMWRYESLDFIGLNSADQSIRLMSTASWQILAFFPSRCPILLESTGHTAWIFAFVVDFFFTSCSYYRSCIPGLFLRDKKRFINNQKIYISVQVLAVWDSCLRGFSRSGAVTRPLWSMHRQTLRSRKP